MEPNLELHLDRRPIMLGRPTTGKTLTAFASAQQCTAVLRRAVDEIAHRETEPTRTAAGDFVVMMDEADVLARFPAEPTLQDLVRTVHQRGPAVGVRINSPRLSR
ncbi:hypothetical protein LN042_23985 [Kitasatospora sp. RB6PN24]|uniref:hypothetical protein n=1 Tax=Kitasatospora humi TaxID=2893891 RepID=UPI001E4242C4|nr:hypothetical protein [Kitasatospora humi]MCC9310090.1 hypothetical protein [Kitasatospora humi]